MWGLYGPTRTKLILISRNVGIMWTDAYKNYFDFKKWYYMDRRVQKFINPLEFVHYIRVPNLIEIFFSIFGDRIFRGTRERKTTFPGHMLISCHLFKERVQIIRAEYTAITYMLQKVSLIFLASAVQ
jgi:hypothetical protein